MAKLRWPKFWCKFLLGTQERGLVFAWCNVYRIEPLFSVISTAVVCVSYFFLFLFLITVWDNNAVIVSTTGKKSVH